MKFRIQITAGQGPEECSWVVEQIAKAFEYEIKNLKHNIQLSVLDERQGKRANSRRSLVLTLSTVNSSATLESWLASWTGTIQWIGSSPYRAKHPRKNWFVAVNIEKLEDEKEVGETSMRNALTNVTVVTFRASGPGGQNVNKVASAVRIVHAPTGLTATAQEHRSQSENRVLALTRLKQKLQSKVLEEKNNTRRTLRNQHFDLQRGNPTRIYSGREFRRIK